MKTKAAAIFDTNYGGKEQKSLQIQTWWKNIGQSQNQKQMFLDWIEGPMIWF